MREILFRGKSKYRGNKWVYGVPCEDYIISKIEWIADEGYEREHPEPLMFPVKPSSIGQFTGLADKNGVKIFEGDIIKAIWRHLGNIDTVIGLVKFIDASFVLETKNEYLFFEDNIFGIECEIIGNIYDRRCENG